MNRRWLVVLLCCVTSAPIPGTAVAQGIGGLVRKKVAEAAGKDEKKDAAQPDVTTVYGGDVLELTEAVMKGFMNGTSVHLALLEEFANLMETYKKPEEYERCREETASSAEATEIMGQLGRMSGDVTAEEIQRVIEKMDRDMIALTKRKCGPDASEDWPHAKRMERLDSIAAKAAAASGAVRTAGPSPELSGGPAFEEDAFESHAVQDLGMTLRQYNISWERAENYCRLLAAGAIHPLQPVVHPADGGKVFWIYSETEARAIEPLCEKIMEIRQNMNILAVHATWDQSMADGINLRTPGGR